MATAGCGAAARLPVVDADRCTGCGRCVGACDLQLLSLEALRWRKSAVLQASDCCTGCAACAASCPFRAITMRALTRVGPVSGV
jgi:NAD-dependent dihydropyrimidine dehydrogenase PreA subunit